MKYNSEQFELDFRNYKGIMAMAKNRCIGKDNKIPWWYADDFKWFKEFTQSKDLKKIIIMGNNTAKLLPPLKNRKICILTKNPFNLPIIYFSSEDNSIISYIRAENELPWNSYELIVAGGKSIYQLFMPKISEFYVTHIDKEYDGDTFMFPFEHLFSKQEIVREFDFGRVVKYSK
jgi:dihydrofolate reductase